MEVKAPPPDIAEPGKLYHTFMVGVVEHEEVFTTLVFTTRER